MPAASSPSPRIAPAGLGAAGLLAADALSLLRSSAGSLWAGAAAAAAAAGSTSFTAGSVTSSLFPGVGGTLPYQGGAQPPPSPAAAPAAAVNESGGSSRALGLSQTFTSALGLGTGGITLPATVGPASIGIAGGAAGASSSSDAQEGNNSLRDSNKYPGSSPVRDSSLRHESASLLTTSAAGAPSSLARRSLTGDEGSNSTGSSMTSQSPTGGISTSFNQLSTASVENRTLSSAAAAAAAVAEPALGASVGSLALGASAATLARLGDVGGTGCAEAAFDAIPSGDAASGDRCLSAYYGVPSRTQHLQQQQQLSSGIPAASGLTLRAGSSGWHSTGSRRGAIGREPPSPTLRGLVSRPELALCLLTEASDVLLSCMPAASATAQQRLLS